MSPHISPPLAVGLSSLLDVLDNPIENVFHQLAVLMYTALRGSGRIWFPPRGLLGGHDARPCASLGVRVFAAHVVALLAAQHASTQTPAVHARDVFAPEAAPQLAALPLPGYARSGVVGALDLPMTFQL